MYKIRFILVINLFIASCSSSKHTNPPLEAENRAESTVVKSPEVKEEKKEEIQSTPPPVVEKKEEVQITPQSPIVEKKEEVQTSPPPHLLGGDLDQFGCKNSAGFEWSKLRKECIRVWVNSIKLPSVSESSFQANLFFSEDKGLAEIFIVEEKESIVLKKVATSTYTYADYKLIFVNNKWKLLKNKLAIYSAP